MPGIKRDFYNVCPVCWSIRVKFRVFKSPRYKCEKCGCEFSNKKRISRDDRILFNGVMKRARDRVKENTLNVLDDVYLRKITVKIVKEYLSHA